MRHKDETPLNPAKALRPQATPGRTSGSSSRKNISQGLQAASAPCNPHGARFAITQYRMTQKPDFHQNRKRAKVHPHCHLNLHGQGILFLIYFHHTISHAVPFMSHVHPEKKNAFQKTLCMYYLPRQNTYYLHTFRSQLINDEFGCH